MWLRVFALQSSIAFGYLSAVYPVMLLHMVLLPINVFHLAKVLLKSSRVRPAAARPTALPRPDRPALIAQWPGSISRPLVARLAIVQTFPSKFAEAGVCGVTKRPRASSTRCSLDRGPWVFSRSRIYKNGAESTIVWANKKATRGGVA